MSPNNNKLELTWVGKYDEQKPVEPRILIEDPKYSYGTVETGVLPNGKPWNGNMLIHGDNLLALKALEQNFTNSVKCIYIDPPFNTGNAFEHYDDGLEHSIWLGLMYKRISILHKLLSDDGVFCLHLDDGEAHYAKVICDEIFGRKNFICTIAVRSSTPSGLKTAHRDKTIIKTKDFILLYKKTDDLSVNPIYTRKGQWDTHFSKYLDKSTLTVYNLIDVLREKGIVAPNTRLGDIQITSDFRKFYLEHKDNIFQTQPVMPQEHKEGSLAMPDQVYKYSSDNGEVNYAMNGRRFFFLSCFFFPLEDGSEDMGVLLCDFWNDIDFQNTQNEGKVSFPASKKPEKLIKRIFTLFTKPGDLVLDSFLGSGTTAAVAHKMNRKYIGIELGNHAYTHCFQRLKAIAAGQDESGISDIERWHGGGGFKFYELAPSLLKEDQFGHLVINKEYNADMLAAAMAKQEGFTYEPSEDVYWKQGRSSENDYIYTTTQFMTLESIAAIAEQMGEGESLLICCTAFQKECRNRFSNITIKKIPQMLLGRCEFNHDDYSLNIIDFPQMECDEDPEDESPIEETPDFGEEQTLF